MTCPPFTGDLTIIHIPRHCGLDLCPVVLTAAYRAAQNGAQRRVGSEDPPMVRSGGCMLGLDHRIPNGTPLANYRFYVEKASEIMEGEVAQLG